MKRLRFAAASVLCMAPLLLSAAAPAPKVVAFNVAVQVDVDAQGQPLKVDVAKDLPEPVRRFIEQQVASWQYEPARVQGQPVPATTYVQVAACAIPTPAGDAFSLAVDFDGNGPRHAGGALMPPPRYPEEAMRHGIEAELVVILDIGTDGGVNVNRVERADFIGSGRRSEFEQELRRWAKSMRFDPERVAGQAVAGQVRIPVQFSLSGDFDRARARLQKEALASRQCQMAQQGGGLRPVALDSVVKVTPVPAG